jgi:hypothetical protein
VKGLLAAAAAALAGFCPAQVLGLRQIVSRVVNHLVLGPLGPNFGMHLGQLEGQGQQQEDEQDFNSA